MEAISVTQGEISRDTVFFPARISPNICCSSRAPFAGATNTDHPILCQGINLGYRLLPEIVSGVSRSHASGSTHVRMSSESRRLRMTLAPGQTVLVRDATSSLGQAAVDVAAEEGATVIAATRKTDRAGLRTRAIRPSMCAAFAWPLWSATGLENVACSARTSGSDSMSPERQSGKSTDASMSHSLSYSSWRRSQLMG
jgi:hypothetical protein